MNRTILFLSVLAVVLGSPDEARSAEDFALPDRSLFDEGSYVYEHHCIVCHGEDGDGRGPMSAQLVPQPRSFRQGLFKYRSTPWGKLPSNADLERVVRGGISGTAMGMFGERLRPREVTAVVEYIKSFSRRWRKVENYAAPLEFPEPPDWLGNKAALREHATSGQAIFNNLCATCHGPAGDGKGPAASGLKDEWGFPATPADLRQPHLRSGDKLSDVYRALTTGLNGTPMVSFAEALTPEQRWDVVAFIATLRPDGSTQ